MAIAVGQPCPLCRTPVKALGTTTYCPDEDKHGRASNDFDYEADTRDLVVHCPDTSCGSIDVVCTGSAGCPWGGNWHHCNDCGLNFIP